ncbi:MAG: trypsin-like peptidase domain-containing protein [Planctomycetota bacterium]|nr:trypsin-like peptidase domain-containing protein [Planctomycetota bacterium]
MKRYCLSVLLVVLLISLGCREPDSGLEAGANAGLARLDFRKVVKDAKDKVFPAVVFIKCLKESHERGKKITEEVSGSGVLISPEGEILTNWHVVDKAVEVRCLLFDGRSMDAKVVGSDKDTDLALVQLKLPDKPDKPNTDADAEKPDTDDAGGLPHAILGDSTTLKEGDFVMAMGAPWGLSRSVSIGIISCTHRFLPSHSEYSLWLQTDAAICPGNSGGPLVNTRGEIIGINTLAAMIGGDMGFAVPAETIAYILPQLREFKKVNWSWTGLQLQPLRDFNRNMYFEGAEGVIVAETDPESPARRAGILARDRILKVAGKPVNAPTEEALPLVRRGLGLLAKDEPVQVELLRKGENVTVMLTPRTKGKVEGEELDCPRWDLTVKAINQFDNPDLYFHRKKGVFIYGVKYPGNASNAGLQTQDIVLKIDGKEVVTLEDVGKIHKAALKEIKKKHRIVFTLLRNGLMCQVVLDFARDFEKE